MRLASSLCLWLSGTTAVVLALHGWLQLEVELTNLKAVMRRELSLVAIAVGSAVENAVRDGQQPDVISLIDQLELNDPDVDIYVFDRDGSLLSGSHGSAEHLALALESVRGTGDADVLRIAELSTPDFVATAPIHIGERTVGHLAVIRPTRALLRDLATERDSVLAAIVGLTLSMSLVIWVVVHLRLHRPVSYVIEAIRKVASGDLSVRIRLKGYDEVAELAHEFDAMTDAIEETRKRLAREIEAREVAEANMQRSNKLVLVGQLAASLAHEIGSPLQVLNGRARALCARDDLPPEVKRNAEILVQQTDRVIDIVERLLDVARRKAPNLADIDVREAVQLVVELNATLARRAGVELRVDMSEVPKVRADAAQMQQVLLNLIQNALRACDRGGRVQVAVERASFVAPGASQAQPSVAIVVEDTGTGIADDVKPRLFEPFFTHWQGEAADKGTGLGLPVVKSIVSDHGGIVTADSLPAGGARFTVHLPARAATASVASEAAP